MAPSSPAAVSTVLFFLFLLTSPTSSDAAVSYKLIRSLLSISHSLITRVAGLRASRGDLAGSRRAQLIADKLERVLGLGFWSLMWSMGWDYVWNYAWRDPTASFQALGGVVYDANELLSWLREFSQSNSDSERAAWITRNYKNVLRVSNSMFGKLLSVFRKTGPLREMVEILKTEMEGDFLRDCIEVGSGDLKGLFQILKELALQYTSRDSDMEDL